MRNKVLADILVQARHDRKKPPIYEFLCPIIVSIRNLVVVSCMDSLGRMQPWWIG